MSSRRGKAGGRGSRIGGRRLKTRLKTAKGRKFSSTRWLERQLNDPYVAEARRLGYPSRAAFKLIELDDLFHLLGPGLGVVDLGSAPGGWSRVAAERVKAGHQGGGHVVALDIAEMEPPPGVTTIRRDFLDENTPELLAKALGGPADLVLSDMSAPVTGHAGTDHLRIVALAEAALDFAEQILAPDGAFVAKVYQGGTERELLARMKRLFKRVRHAKPPASRPASAEVYVVAQGFKGSSGG
ncbi:MAG: RlmE family RNA methyltransferase [Rhodospirillales bacterium]|nr:RlmE family RNA methyltransferase [Rhodospirillales bacterium]MDP7098202.1 RlmE family RNA methyltransferase [Rhodospirillales bacterium]MDP7216448.1 RlmE family RNA methyltransferase [Rhodospirillales bacterium]